MKLSQLLRRRASARNVKSHSTLGRVVLVLGSSGVAQIERAFHLASERRTSVCILSLGYPQSPRQRAAIESAIESAWESSVRLEAILVPGSGDIYRHLLPGDDLLD